MGPMYARTISKGDRLHRNAGLLGSDWGNLHRKDWDGSWGHGGILMPGKGIQSG